MNTRPIRRWTGMLGGLLPAVAATSFGTARCCTRDTALRFTPTTFTASGVPEFALKTLSPTHQVRISTKGQSDIS